MRSCVSRRTNGLKRSKLLEDDKHLLLIQDWAAVKGWALAFNLTFVLCTKITYLYELGKIWNVYLFFDGLLPIIVKYILCVTTYLERVFSQCEVKSQFHVLPKFFCQRKSLKVLQNKFPFYTHTHKHTHTTKVHIFTSKFYYISSFFKTTLKNIIFRH